MNKYEKLLDSAYSDGLSVDENYCFNGDASGLYVDGNIALSDKLKTTAEKSCVLAEELGHHYTTVGNILDLTSSQNRKQERHARLWAYNENIGLCGLIKAYEHGCRDCHEIAEYLEVTEAFLDEAVSCFRDKYGICTTVDHYAIFFIPQLAIGMIIK